MEAENNSMDVKPVVETVTFDDPGATGKKAETSEGIEERIAKIEADYAERLQMQSAKIGKLENTLKRITAEPTKIEEKKPNKELDNSLVARMEQLEQAAKKHQSKVKKLAVVNAMVKNDISADHAQLFSKLIVSDYADSIVVNDDDEVYFDDNGDAVPVEKWFSAYLQTDKGQLYKTFKTSPTPRGVGGREHSGITGKKTVSSIEYARILSATPKDQREALASKYVIEG